MHVVVMGCGRVGSTIAHSLEAAGATVAVVDQDAAAFRRLGEDFAGQTVVGVGFDRDTLATAGIERADAFAAVSSGDNSNIIAARVARETFGVTNVVARIYDPRRAEVYARLGIPTVATVRWTADEMLRRILGETAHSVWSEPTGKLTLAEVAYDQGWVGQRVASIEEGSGSRVAYLTRYGEARLVDGSSILQDGDLLHVFVDRGDLERVEGILTDKPQEPNS
jgi:trk system potassium uptake protein TrkA